MTATEASRDFETVLALVREDEETTIVDNQGEMVAVLMSPETYRKIAYDRFWATVDRIRDRNAGMDPDEINRDVTEVVEEVRQERYERELAADRGR